MKPATHASIERCFSQADLNSFARLSGDNNPIHTDTAFSTGTRFGRTVAHGVLLCSVLRGLIEQLLPGGRLLQQSVVFPAPTYTGERICFTVKVGSKDDTGTHVELRAVHVADGTVTCQGDGKVAS